MTSLSCWNVRFGIDPPSKRREVKYLLKNNNLSLCGLVETEVRSINTDVISRKLFGYWEVLIIMSMHCWANLSWLGSVDSKVTPIYKIDQIIHVFCIVIS